MAGAIARTLARMSYVLPPAEGSRPTGDGRALAMLNYGLFFSSIFFAGVPALIAVALAYSQKSKAPPLLRAHYRFQIGMFWTSFLLALIAGLLFLTGMASAVLEFISDNGGEWLGFPQLRQLRAHGLTLGLIIGGFLLAAFDTLGLMICSAVGFIRLASAPPLGKSAV